MLAFYENAQFAAAYQFGAALLNECFVLLPVLGAGFNFIAFTVAIRVVFGHSGNLQRLQKPLWFFIATTMLLFFAMISRFAADFAPRMGIEHLLGAAICWLLAALVWIPSVIPKVATPDTQE